MKSRIYNLRFNEELGFKTIAKKLGISKNTVKKYVSNFEEEISHWGVLTPEEYDNQITEMFKKNKMKTANRKPRVLEESHIKFIKECLESNSQKIERGKKKQLMKVTDIYEELVDEHRYEGKYGAVLSYVNSINEKKKETFIKRIFDPSTCVEFDWGNVELVINGKVKEYKLAVFTSCHSNYRWAKLYERENMEAFIDSHISFHKHTKGVFKKYVYDNMRVAVAKFVGKSEKTPTSDLVKMSIFYNFEFSFCNAYSGNEKGKVERSVEVIRRKSFSHVNEFETFEHAEQRLNYKVLKLNERIPKQNLYEDYAHLKTFQYDYSFSEDLTSRVTKYSTIIVDNSHYSVPEKFTGKIVEAKKSIDYIHIYEKDKLVYTHKRNRSHASWFIDIEHYLDTFSRKPGGLKDSLAIRQVDDKVKKLYFLHYLKNTKEFILLIPTIKKHGIDLVSDTIEKLLTLKLGISQSEVELMIATTNEEDYKKNESNVCVNNMIKNNIKLLSRMAL